MLHFLRKHVSTLRFTLLLIVLLCWLLPTLILGVYMGARVFQTLQVKTESALRSGAEYAQSMAVRNIDNITTLARDTVYDNELNAAVQDYCCTLPRFPAITTMAIWERTPIGLSTGWRPAASAFGRRCRWGRRMRICRRIPRSRFMPATRA